MRTENIEVDIATKYIPKENPILPPFIEERIKQEKSKGTYTMTSKDNDATTWHGVNIPSLLEFLVGMTFHCSYCKLLQFLSKSS